MTIVSNLIAIFIGLIAFIGIVGTLAGWYIINRVTSAVIKDAYLLVKNLINEQVSFARHFTFAQILGRISYTYFGYYQTEFRDALNGDFPPEREEILRISRGAGFARHLADDALATLDDIEDKSLADSKYNIQHLRLALLNYYIYHQTVEMICVREIDGSVDEEKRIHLLERTTECISLANSKESSTFSGWYESIDSAARAKIQLGGREIQKKGIKLIQEICNGERPSEDHVSVPVERIRKFKGDYNLDGDDESDGQSESSSAQ